MNKMQTLDNQNWEQGCVGGKEPFFLKRKLSSEEKGIDISILKLEPNTAYPHHSHEFKEWVYVLSGEMKDERGDYKEGDLIINEIGSEHQVTSGTNGTQMLVIKYLGENK